MNATTATGTPSHISLPQGVIRYREAGSGPPLLFVHGAFVNGDLWRNVVPPLAASFRCIVPDLPLGAHRQPLPPGADLSLPGLAQLVADFSAALDLRNITLIGNDTGGAICQLVVARHPGLLSGLVLTNCDAFANMPPPLVKPLTVGARLPGFGWLLGQSLRSRLVQRALVATVAHRFPEPAVAQSYFAPVVADPGVRRDLVALLRAVSSRDTLDAARAFPSFTKPVLIVWAPEDKLLFPLRDAERLRDAFPQARLELVTGSRALIPEDQPERLAALIDAFLRSPGVVAASPGRGSGHASP
jgi:pimeloyl-ACP methyl ester carboxylesterase